MRTASYIFPGLFLTALLAPATGLSGGVEPTDSLVTYSEASSSIRDYQQEIRLLKTRAGPYSESLVAPLLSLGLLQNENRQYADADTTLHSALRIHRINHGLHDLSQIPILELIISNNISQQNWKATNDNFHLYHWVHRRNYGEADPAMLAILDKLIGWHLLATKLETGPHPGEHFLTLLELHEAALHIVENNPAYTRLELANRLYKLALVHYYIAIAVQRAEPIGIYLAQKFNPIQNGESYATTSEKIVRDRFRKSRKLVNRVAMLYENNSSEARGSDAIALLYLADWDLLFNRRAQANRGYRLTYKRLLESGFSREMVNSFFMEPKLLPKSEFSPALMALHATGHTQVGQTLAVGEIQFVGWSTALPGVKFPAAQVGHIVTPATERYALVSFDVLKDGLTENIRISRDNPENSLPRHATYEAIWSAQFRPRLLDGEAVAASGMSTRFYLPSMETGQ